MATLTLVRVVMLPSRSYTVQTRRNRCGGVETAGGVSQVGLQDQTPFPVAPRSTLFPDPPDPAGRRSLPRFLRDFFPDLHVASAESPICARWAHRRSARPDAASTAHLINELRSGSPRRATSSLGYCGSFARRGLGGTDVG